MHSLRKVTKESGDLKELQSLCLFPLKFKHSLFIIIPVYFLFVLQPQSRLPRAVSQQTCHLQHCPQDLAGGVHHCHLWRVRPARRHLSPRYSRLLSALRASASNDPATAAGGPEQRCWRCGVTSTAESVALQQHQLQRFQSRWRCCYAAEAKRYW